jgi:hypothetical protein
MPGHRLEMFSSQADRQVTLFFVYRRVVAASLARWPVAAVNF